MISKTDRIRTAWASGDRIAALRIAGRFFDRSIETKAFKRGIGAYNNPSFYRQLGTDPDQLLAEALEALARKFGLHDPCAEAANDKPVVPGQATSDAVRPFR
jgi:hypothetical protein